ncbi:type IV pilin protein [Pseudoxanthomonas sp. 22568]|uniref:type IV pilin protein n=1 Tax=Pseudoxanthomonas sp. 22568 TaxID=3453945 RepID=UPI00296EE483|nr:type IV pilin protein [Pseudoxanthomonas japonensis]
MKQRGFSLLELLIVLAITAILATIAYASYRDQVIKSRRSAGAACLQERAQYLERYYTTNMSYVDGEDALGQCDAEVQPFYTISEVAAFDATSYAIQAEPTEDQPDPKCGTLTLNSRGEKGESGTGTVADCW